MFDVAMTCRHAVNFEMLLLCKLQLRLALDVAESAPVALRSVVSVLL